MAGTPTNISGARTTSNILSARRVVDMAPKIIMLEDDRKSLMTFVSSLGTRPVTNPQFTWLTDEIVPKTGLTGTATIASTAATGTATLKLDGTTTTKVYLKVDDVIKIVSNGEVMRVTATPTNMSAVDVLRNVAGASVASCASGVQWVKIGNNREENSTLRDSAGSLISLTTQEASAQNYTQTFRDAFGLSRREDKSNLYGGPDRAHQRMKKLLEHCEQQENAFWHGVSATDASGRTYTQGMLTSIPSGNTEAITTLTEDEFDDFVRRISRYGNTSRRVLFCSRFVGQLISGWARANQRITNVGTSTKYGVQVNEYLTGSGVTVDLITTNALEGVPGATANGTWDGYACLVDPENIKKAVFGGCDTQLELDLQLPDQDGLVDSYKSDVGLQYGHASHHGLITGVTA